jgi:hypothetical protein
VESKVLGYLLLASGLILVTFSLLSVYQVFTNKIQPIQLFNQRGISLDLRQILGPSLSPSLDLASSSASGQLELLSADSLNKMFNLTFHLVFMGFVSTVGFRLGTLGNQFLRPIIVDIKSLEKSKPLS